MQIHVETRPPEQQPVELLAVPLCALEAEGTRLPSALLALDRAMQGRLRAALETGDFRGRKRQQLLLYGQGELAARRLLLVGLGEERKVTGEELREAAGSSVRAAAERRISKLALILPRLRRLRAPAVAQALAEGALLGDYRFDRHQSGEPEEGQERPGHVEQLHLGVSAGTELRAVRAAVRTGQVLAESQNLARDLSNEPPNLLSPAALARVAQRCARQTGLRCRVLEGAQLRKLGMGALLAVAGGSHRTPRLIVLEHGRPAAGGKASARRRTLCLVGKGVCFDSGGLSLKPSASMVRMKHDMSGGAAVIGALRAAALLRIPLHVVGIVGAVENMPSGTAYRPDDILVSGSGKSIEVTNTDAEGRLVLADALHYARSQFAPEAIVDIATLTGACAIALGPWAAAVVTNDDSLARRILHAGEAVGERFWQLPLWDAHREHMRSRVADVRQTGGREAGTITAAAFLSHFVGETPWAHLDIASTADTDRSTPLHRRGATGFAVRTLVETLRSFTRDRR